MESWGAGPELQRSVDEFGFGVVKVWVRQEELRGVRTCQWGRGKGLETPVKQRTLLAW